MLDIKDTIVRFEIINHKKIKHIVKVQACGCESHKGTLRLLV